MDALIKGMEMPKSCDRCFYTRFCLAHARRVQKIMESDADQVFDVFGEMRLGDCSLVELPPHGEAKDTDIAIRYIKSEMEDDFNETTTLDEKSYKEGMKRAIELIGYAPTVLEASE